MSLLFPHRLLTKVLNLIKMGRYFHQPFRLYLYHISHILLCSQYQFMVNHTLRLIFYQHRTRMNSHRKVELTRLIEVLILLCTVHEKCRYYTFTDIRVLVILIYAQLLIAYVNLNSLHQ